MSADGGGGGGNGGGDGGNRGGGERSARGGVRRGVDLKVSPEIARGAYANVALISHTPNEFVFDFALAVPGQPPHLTSRVVTSAAHAKAFLRSLADNVRRYEARHGPIPEPPMTRPGAPGAADDGTDEEHN